MVGSTEGRRRSALSRTRAAARRTSRRCRAGAATAGRRPARWARARRPRPRARAARRPRSAYVGRPASDRTDHAGRLRDARGAGRVDDDSPGPHALQRAVEQGALQRDQARRGRSGRAATGLRPPPQRTETRCTARRPAPGRTCPGATTGRVPSPATTSPPGWPARACRTRVARCGSRSLASSRAPRVAPIAASSAALPPGPAHRSSQRSSRPSTSARVSASATSCEPASCTPARPSRTAGTSPGSPDVQHHGEGRDVSTRSGSTRPAVAAELLDRRQPRPRHEGHPGPLVVGGEQRLELLGPVEGLGERVHDPGGVRGPHVPAARRAPSIHPSRSRAAIRRITALVNPAGLCPTRARTSSTVLVTAAWSGTRMASSWWAPSRSASRTPGRGAGSRGGRPRRRTPRARAACPRPARWRRRRRGPRSGARAAARAGSGWRRRPARGRRRSTS